MGIFWAIQVLIINYYIFYILFFVTKGDEFHHVFMSEWIPKHMFVIFLI